MSLLDAQLVVFVLPVLSYSRHKFTNIHIHKINILLFELLQNEMFAPG